MFDSWVIYDVQLYIQKAWQADCSREWNYTAKKSQGLSGVPSSLLIAQGICQAAEWELERGHCSKTTWFAIPRLALPVSDLWGLGVTDLFSLSLNVCIPKMRGCILRRWGTLGSDKMMRSCALLHLPRHLAGNQEVIGDTFLSCFSLYYFHLLNHTRIHPFLFLLVVPALCQALCHLEILNLKHPVLPSIYAPGLSIPTHHEITAREVAFYLFFLHHQCQAW